jgi:hypothetical protein
MTTTTAQSLQISDKFSDKFSENLAQIPEQPTLAALELKDGAGNVVAKIENKPGQAGSLRVYAWLATQFGSITPEAASLALKIYAEHIDRLFQIQSSGQALSVQTIAQAAEY